MQEPQPPEPRYTAWHFFLAYCLQYLVDPSRLEVHVFEKLGVLPLEADVLILRKVADLTGAARLPDFDFLWPYLGHYTVLEYKSPDDLLTPEDLDRLRTYGLLCKHKYGVKWERKVRLLLLYSHVQADFFATCEQNELPFVEGGRARGPPVPAAGDADRRPEPGVCGPAYPSQRDQPAVGAPPPVHPRGAGRGAALGSGAVPLTCSYMLSSPHRRSGRSWIQPSSRACPS
jgi:hypothetical protein